MPRSLILCFVLFSTVACGSLSKGAPRTSQSLFGPSKKSSSAPRLAAGSMDGVEYLITSDIQADGEDEPKASRFKELRSVYDSDKIWQPDRHFDIPFAKNDRVDKWVEIFSGSMNARFSQWIRRLSIYAPLMEDILEEYGLPKDLIYLAMIESGVNLNAYSHAHAAGLWQFIRSTGSMYGLRSSGLVDERRDVLRSTKAAASHLKDLYGIYKDWYLAFAAYNAGPGKVNRAIRSCGSRNYWALSAGSRCFRPETRDYVPRILAAAYVVKNYQRYHFSERLFETPLEMDLAMVDESVDVDQIAKMAGVSLEEILYLNPALVFGVTPSKERYTLYLPSGTKETFVDNYSRRPKTKTELVVHKVRSRESLAVVANKYRVSRLSLAQANQLNTRLPLKTGQILVIPNHLKTYPKIFDRPVVASRSRFFAKSSNKKGKKEEDLIAEEIEELNPEADGVEVVTEEPQEELVAVAPLLPAAPLVAPPEAKTYRVRRGDTLSLIANRHGLRLNQLKEWNGLATSRIKSGQTLQVSETRDALEVPQEEPEFLVHSVKSGETLWNLSQRYRISVAQIKTWNGLSSNHLKLSQKIRIYFGKKIAAI